MSRKICFVAMGFGKKMDYRNSKEVDLDIIYKKVIKNLFDSLTEYELIRADEISGSEIIDVSMYSLLLKADLVINHWMNPSILMMKIILCVKLERIILLILQ